MAELENREKRQKRLLGEINHIDNWTNAAADNGLFDRIGKQEYFDDIQSNLRAAREKLYAGDFVDSEYYTSLALRLYGKALYSTSRIWRFSNMYAGPLWIYFAALLVSSMIILYYFGFNTSANFITRESAISVVALGIIGSLFRSSWYLYDKVAERKYKRSFRIYFISAPFFGGLFGLIVYLALFYESFILQYVLSLSDTSHKVAAISAFTIIPFAIFGGFNWEWVITIVKKIGQAAITTKTTDADYEDERERSLSKGSKEEQAEKEQAKDLFRYRNVVKLLYITIPLLVIFMVVSFIPALRETEFLYPLGSILLNIVITALVWLAAFVVRKKEFRFDFAKLYIDKSLEVEDKIQRVKYLNMGLASYNKFLRRHLNFEINDKLYPQIIQTYITSDNESKNISKAFKAGKIEPVKYLSSLVPGAPIFMKEKWGDKIRTWGTFAVTIIPVIITLIQILLPKYFTKFGG